MSLLNYWPALEEVNNCIKAEAENASDEVLLAVHQQFPLSHLKVGPDGRVIPESQTVATENDLLKYFISDAPSGSHVVPITGASGVGKSHLIRILDARIQRLPNADSYLVIRIPKSASLRRVVELILEAEPLRVAKYDQVRSEFKKALADVSLDEAVIRFQAQLEIALNDYAVKHRELLNNDPTNASIKERIGHARDLPKLFADAEVVEHFRFKVFPRIIQRSVKGAELKDTGVKEIDPTLSQFNVNDFDFREINFGQASTQVEKYFKFNLEARDGHGKAVAVEVLNSVIDPATEQLYQLNQSLGGMTLGEVILEIRRLLLADKRELVILVEDFAALVGIQDTLAKVLIQEGVTSRGVEFATIRSAIAVTDGYISGTQTLATRAGRQWVVESQLKTDEETIRRTKLLVASYINAARHGESALKQHYQKVLAEPGFSEKRWTAPAYVADDEDTHIIDAFGRIGQIPLFPFTEQAIECLARPVLTSGNSLVFSPRYVIKNVIREVVSARESFIGKHFPPPWLYVKGSSAEVAQWFSSLSLSDEVRKRYESVVTIWGNNPRTVAEIGRIPKEVFEVFGLPVPELEYTKQAHKPVKPTEPNVEKREPEVTNRQEQQITDIQDTLHNWVINGTPLKQGIANSIRKNLANAINRVIDWNAERCGVKREISSNQISIPNALGEGGISSNAIKIAPNSDDSDGHLRSDLFSLLRFFDVFDSSRDYDGFEDDFARIANLVDRLLPEALEVIRASIRKQNSLATSALAANSRLLGITERGKTLSSISTFLFADADPLETLPETVPTPFKEWRSLQNTAVEIRPQLRKLLSTTSGCFQGTGTDTPKIYGVDIVTILDSFPEDSASSDLSDLFAIDPTLKQPLMVTRQQTVISRLNQVQTEAKRIQNYIIKELGADFDKQQVINVLRDLAASLSDMGVWNSHEIGLSTREFTTLCEDFRLTAIKESIEKITQMGETSSDDQSPNKKIINCAQLPLLPLVTTERFLSNSSKLIRAAEQQAQILEAKFLGIDPNEKATELSNTFNALVENLAQLQEGGA